MAPQSEGDSGNRQAALSGIWGRCRVIHQPGCIGLVAERVQPREAPHLVSIERAAICIGCNITVNTVGNRRRLLLFRGLFRFCNGRFFLFLTDQPGCDQPILAGRVQAAELAHHTCLNAGPGWVFSDA